MLSRKVIEWGERNISEKWRVIPFQPIVFLFSFIGVIHVLATPGETIDFAKVFGGEWAYGAWVSLMIFTPVLFVSSCYLIGYTTGKWLYRGYWFRFAASTGQFVAILSFLLAWVGAGRAVGNDYRHMSLFLDVAVLVFLAATVIRDTWKLLLIESVARHIHSITKEG